jgi:protein-tyrosine phosphatase
MEETVRHARRLDADGVHDVACTPHVKRAHFPRVPLCELAAVRLEAQRCLDADGLEVRLHPGGELAHHDALELELDRLALIAQGPSDAAWLLLECPFEGIEEDFLIAAERLTALGFGLLLAHPERADGGLERLRPLLDDGALLQVNVSSLLGRHGPDALRIGAELVRTGLAYCLASDGHPGSREDTLARGFDALLRAGASEMQAYRLTQSNPRFLLHEGIPRLVPGALSQAS